MKKYASVFVDRFLWWFTAVNGLCFAVCIWIMANDYRPLVADNLAGKQINEQLYCCVSNELSAVSQQLSSMSDDFTFFSEQPSFCKFPTENVVDAFENLAGLGAQLLNYTGSE